MRRTQIIFALFTALQFAQAQVTLTVDATEAPRKILHATESISIKPGPLTLLYPQWIPGEHGPTGPVVDLTGLTIKAAGKSIAWRRDLENMYAFHLEVPNGVNQIDLSFDFILSPHKEGFSSAASSSSNLAIVSWNQVVLYASNLKPDDIVVNASMILPKGWKFATALRTKAQSGNTVHFLPVSLMLLVDSPVLTGAYFRRIDLTPPSGVPHYINLAGDSEEALEMSAEQIEAYRRLVSEALALFGAHHYNHYDFLFALSDHVAHFGLEHHQASDNRLDERTLIDEDLRRTSVTLLPHELVHSWNGKYRRPAGLATGDFSTPVKDDLLWVYEGLTQYLGNLLAARSGLRTPEEYRENLARVAAYLDHRPGRQWRSLQDVADAAQVLYEARADWESWRRGVDFYDESVLIWLEVDVIVRQLTKGKKSLDDFCRRFHGGESAGPVVKPYTFDEVVTTLNEVAAFDWKSFFTSRLQSLNPRAPMQGIEKSGWKVIYKETPNSLQKAEERTRRVIDLRYSLGLYLREDGTIVDVVPGSPAALAGLAPTMKLIAVNGRKYTKDAFRTALKSAKTATGMIELLAMNGDFIATHAVHYSGGERYPYLERDTANPDVLSAIIKPIAAKRKESKK